MKELLKNQSWYSLGNRGLLVFLILMISAYPVAMLCISSFRIDGEFSIQNFLQILQDQDYFLVFKNTLFVCLWVIIFSTALGVALAWIVERTDIPGRTLLKTIFTLPYLIPPFIAAFAWRQLLGPVGYFNKLSMSIFGTREPVFGIYGPHGIIIVLTLLTYPIMYIITVRSLRIMNPELEEAAELCGAGTMKVALTVTLPLILPSISGAIVLIFATCISNFGVPAVLGLPANYPMLTTTIYTTILDYTHSNNLSLASALSLSLVVMGIGILFFQKSALWKKRFAISGQKVLQPRTIPLGKWRHVVFALCLVLVFFTIIAPIGGLLLDSLIKAYGLPLKLSNLTFKNFHKIFTMRLTQTSLKNSVFLSIIAASVTSIIGFAVAYARIMTKSRWGNLLDFIGMTPNAIPGTVLALGMILAWIKPIPIVNISIYNTIWIIFISYIARYLAYTLRTSTSALEQMDPSLEEAAYLFGANRLQIIRDITFPILRSSLIGGWLLVAIPVLNELTVSILLYSSGRETIGVAAFLLIQEGAVSSAAALGFVMIVLVVVGNLIISTVSRGKISLL
jgi:iron(III) transport system permease protein